MKKLLLLCLMLSIMIACTRPHDSQTAGSSPPISEDTALAARQAAEEQLQKQTKHTEWVEQHKIELEPHHILVDFSTAGNQNISTYITLDTLTGFYYEF